MLSKTAKYALSAVIFIRENSVEGKKFQSTEIAEGINAPKPYVSKLLQQLSRQGILSSTKGPNGGFYLNEENLASPMIDIIYSIDGESRIHSCVLDIEKCNIDNPCALHDVIAPTKLALLDYLKSHSIGDLGTT